MPKIELPQGSHYAVMWGIPEKYAGMTSAMLHRSRAFVRLAGVDVTIVTYEFREDYDLVRKQLRDRGDLIDGMAMINLWEDLRDWDDARLKASMNSFVEGADSTFAPLPADFEREHPLRAVSHDEKGQISQVDYFRTDGTLLASDRRQVPGPKSRSVTLCDRSGAPIGTWQRVWDLYWFWLDSLPREPVAWFIVDSKTSANHFSHYQRPDAVSMYLVHGSHLAPGSKRPHGDLTPGRKQSFENLDKWDAAVLLTQQQLDDVDLLLGEGANRYVCPNGRQLPDALDNLDRPSNKGAMLASLTKRKRVSHAVKAIALANTGLWLGRTKGAKPTLDIYGDGVRRPLIEKLIARVKQTNNVTVHGYVDKAAARLQTASYSILTSTQEGQPLAITESMAAGCIPISYDIPYGPADVITDGVDGYLLTESDIKGLARRIKKISRSTPAQLEPMRRAAFQRAQDFNDNHVTQRWADIMNSALAAKSTR